MIPPTTLNTALGAALETALALLPAAGRLLLLLFLAAALLARAARRFLPGFGERIALDRWALGWLLHYVIVVFGGVGTVWRDGPRPQER